MNNSHTPNRLINTISTLGNHPALLPVVSKISELEGQIARLESIIGVTALEPNAGTEAELKDLCVELSQQEKRYFRLWLDNLFEMGDRTL